MSPQGWSRWIWRRERALRFCLFFMADRISQLCGCQTGASYAQEAWVS
jgi:hypothetical protein